MSNLFQKKIILKISVIGGQSASFPVCTLSAITERIKNVHDKIISECQKAYSKNKCLQEADINILDSINKGIKANSNVNLICIDFRKAFDTLSHSFIVEFYIFLLNWIC